MQYTTLGRTGIRASRVSFGAIKLPEISQPVASEILNLALDLGMNYIDTARNYRSSERMIGAAVGRRRDEFSLATKSSGRGQEDAWRDLETSRRELGMDRIDLWQLHSVSGRDEWQRSMAPGGALTAAKKALAQGIVGHIGITIHRDLSVMREAILCDEFETIMLCHNLLDSENVAGEILPLAHERNLGTIIMKPLSGGSLSSGEPESEADSVARGSLRALLVDDNIDVLIPGMQRLREVRENCATGAMPPMTAEERAGLLRRVGELHGRHRYGQRCLRCGYCLEVCPEKLPIPELFRARDMYGAYPEHLRYLAVEHYRALPAHADACRACRSCVPKCPAALDIPEMLVEVAETFAALL